MKYVLTEEEELLCAKRVARGAEYLDFALPDWFMRINTSVLDMTDGSCCVIGQIYGAFTRTIQNVFGWTEIDAENYGVLINDGDDEDMRVDGPQWVALYGELRECWLGEIADRLNGAQCG